MKSETRQPADEMHRVPKVAKRLKVSPAKVYLMAAAGEIGCIRIGRSVRIPESAVQKYIAEHASE